VVLSLLVAIPGFCPAHLSVQLSVRDRCNCDRLHEIWRVAVYAGIPGKSSTQTGFGALTYTTSPPTGLLGVGLGGDSSPRMVAFQARIEF
jgi:hypothetical protein